MNHRSLVLLSVLASALLATPALADSGGPDGFGHIFVDDQEADGPSYTWHTVSTSVGSASSCDDCSSSVTLPFSFNFYGTIHSSLWVGSNGYVTFDSGDSDYSNSALNTSDASHVAIHAWWDDWDPRASESMVTYGTIGSTVGSRVFVVSWNEVRHYYYSSNPNGVSFQLHLYEADNSIEFHYQDTNATGDSWDDGNSGTVGIDNGTGTYLQYSHNTESLQDGRAIRIVPNQAPVADIGGPGAGDEGAAIALDGSGSTDDGTIVSYEWDCDNDGVYEQLLTSATTTCTWDDNGNQTVWLRVTDDLGATDEVSGIVNVSNVAPTFDVITTPDGDEGVPVTFSATWTDPGAADTHTVDWDFGDTTIDTGATVTHTYPDNGTYTVWITVTDDDGGFDQTTSTVTIDNVAPSIDSVTIPFSGLEGEALAFTATASDVAADSITYEWDFGDLGTAAGDTVNHTYIDDGTYTVTLTVSDGGDDSVWTGTLPISNVDPTIDSHTIPSGAEGDVLVFTAAASDPGDDTLTYAWDFGDSGTGSGDTVNHTYNDEGSYTVTLTVTEEDGGIATVTGTATITNVAPAISALTGDTTGDEGEILSFSAPATDPGADTLTWTWDFGDGTPTIAGSVDSISHAWADDGAYTVTLVVDDGDGGTDTATLGVTIANADPTVVTATVPTGDEGSLVDFDATATDPGDDTLTYEWDFGDGSPATAGPFAQHTYTDDAAFPVTLTVSDEDGGSTTWTGTANIANVAPGLTAFNGPLTGNEGEVLAFDAAADDVGIDDLPDLTFAWDFGDGSPLEVGDALTHAFGDEGSYTVSVIVADGDGGTDTDSLVVDIANVAPEITSSAPAFAAEGVLWSYDAVAVDPGDDVLTWSLSPSAPDGMTIDASSGQLEWTPTYEQSLGGPYPATLTVDDGDGGTDVEVFTVTVGWADDDGDGMADEWETENGLDPTDPADGAADDDGDGLTNLEEFEDGTDPNSFDGPEAPVLVAPIEQEWVTTATPDLLVDNAFDPQGDPLEYDFEVYEDAALTILVATAGGAVAEDASGQTAWKVDVPLTENATYWWRAAAADPFVWGPWSDAEDFVVNAANEAPEAPTPIFPIDGETAADEAVELQWLAGVEPEGDDVTFSVRVWDEALTAIVAEVADIFPAFDAAGFWVVDPPLAEDTWYAWEVAATDEHGLMGDWSELELFFHDTSNAAPAGIAFLEPEQDDVIDSLSPDLVASEGVDPEGGALTYRFEVDLVETFDSGDLLTTDLPGTDTGEVTWSLLDDGVELAEDTLVWARVRGLDPGGVGSDWDVISFFVAGDNTAPPVPELLAPEDGATTDEVVPTLVVGNVLDPEGELVFFDFVVARDLEMTDVVTGREGVLAGSGSEGDQDRTSWTVDLNLEGDYFWTARAKDGAGAASDWAEPFALHVATGLGDDDDSAGDDDDDDGGSGCDCDASLVAAPRTTAPAWALLALVSLALRRRR